MSTAVCAFRPAPRPTRTAEPIASRSAASSASRYTAVERILAARATPRTLDEYVAETTGSKRRSAMPVLRRVTSPSTTACRSPRPAAILDRFAMHAIRIDIDGPSYRRHVAELRASDRAPAL
jgi:hypothetical protein